ncbi:2-oxo-4-hydroxy-4-carboxy-5-ureidoimidazoline decarboxylase [Flexivirga oryzae]|uniref:2-oxo-4-hydroxy-4-carboxy-5-ureidoimidazoline decarboxylase n=1 Tax=Flexivirga oryzae TaxID=1794944 RepID=A0A839N0D6_9MICO|nr:2-oxo-4-hydroxy-4-carboxy-5-ureidoimidazoline decarboxylase [Flexivirga oryzae]MBB2891168.1 2-oxo-4-hydroxy-4-carboxy-5-ureidoimidazoline decarboxylase [Flexivirga oryzae]
MRNTTSTQRNTLEGFNTASDDDAFRTLLPLCSADRWARAVAAGRPYADLGALLEASDRVFGELEVADLDAALAGHPRIGDRVGGDDEAARLSRSEQSAMQSADQQVADQILAGNAAYEQRFDRVFLIRAAGRAPEEILAELQRRLGNDPATEVAEVREQLRQITRLRLEATFSA